MGRYDDERRQRSVQRQLEDETLRAQESLELERRLRRIERQYRTGSRKKPPRTHLLIGDGHAKPGVPNDRFDWLGRMVLDLRPDVVVNMGDGHDMPSLNWYEDFPHSHYQADVRAGNDAYERVRQPTLEWNRGKKREKQYRPLWLQLGGNHDEGRIKKLLSEKPELSGTASVSDIQVVGWEYVPFLKQIELDGITYSHYFKSPGGKREITGVVPARTVLSRVHRSVAFAHNHRFGYYEEFDFMALNCGWYGGGDEYYAHTDNELWRKGIAVLHDVWCGKGDLEWWSVGRIKKRWG